MKFINTEGVVGGLEEGLGEVPFPWSPPPSHLRLRDGVCGVTSLAVCEVLGELGYSAQPVLIKPELPVDPTLEHVVTVVSTEEGDYCIDPTYSQFLRFAGLTTYSARYGGFDAEYPAEKIAIFRLGDHQGVARTLSGIAARLMVHERNREMQKDDPRDIPHLRKRFRGMNREEIQHQLMRVWDTSRMEEFEPVDEVISAGHIIASHVIGENAVLVNDDGREIARR